MPRSRKDSLLKIQAMIESQGWPRIQMALLVCLTGAIGFLTSALLLHHGMTTLWVRWSAPPFLYHSQGEFPA